MGVHCTYEHPAAIVGTSPCGCPLPRCVHAYWGLADTHKGMSLRFCASVREILLSAGIRAGGCVGSEGSAISLPPDRPCNVVLVDIDVLHQQFHPLHRQLTIRDIEGVDDRPPGPIIRRSLGAGQFRLGFEEEYRSNRRACGVQVADAGRGVHRAAAGLPADMLVSALTVLLVDCLAVPDRQRGVSHLREGEAISAALVAGGATVGADSR